MEALKSALSSAQISNHNQLPNHAVPVTCSESVNDVNLTLSNDSPSQGNNGVSVSCVLGGAADNTASGIARRLVLKSGLHVILASNIPKNFSLLEAQAEKLLVQKLNQSRLYKAKIRGRIIIIVPLMSIHALLYRFQKWVVSSEAPTSSC